MSNLISQVGIKKILANKLIVGVTAAVATVAVAAVVIVATRDPGVRSLSVFEVDGSGAVDRDGTSLDLYKGMKLENGDSIQVEEDSTARLLLDEDKYVLLEPGTKIDLVATGNTNDSNTKIELKAGAVVNELHNKLSENSTYEVNTPASTMAVRGTVFRVAITKDKDGEYLVDVSVFEGNVGSKLISQDGKVDESEVMIPTGKAARISSTAELTEYVFDDEDIDYSTLPIIVLEYLVDLIENKTMPELNVDVNMLKEIIAELQKTDKEVEDSDIDEPNQEDLEGDTNETIVADETGTPEGNQTTPVGNQTRPAGNQTTPGGNPPEPPAPVPPTPVPPTPVPPAQGVKVHFFADGITSNITVLSGGKIEQPAAPSRTGYTFTGWYKDAGATTAWNFENDVVQDEMTLYAGWRANRYKVLFETDGGSAVAEIEGEYNALIAKPTNPTRVGYTFLDWYKDNEKTAVWNFLNDVITGNITLFGGWTVNSYAVSFDSAGGTGVTSVQANHGSTITKPLDPSKVGHSFGGWYKEATCKTPWNFTTDILTQATTVYAKWTINSYAVSFDSVGGTGVTSVQVNYGSPISNPKKPTKEGYTFQGWYKEATCKTLWNFETDVVQGEMTLYAGWKGNPHKILFEANMDSEPVEIEGEYNGFITKPADPILVGFTFNGWYKDEDLNQMWNFSTDVIKGDTTLYGGWTINEYTVSFDSLGGTAINSVQIKYGNRIDTQPTAPTKVGYTFKGWYKDNEQKIEWNFLDDVITGNITLYGGWKLNNYTVSFDLDGGTGVTSVQANHGSEIAKPTNMPTKEGHTFSGWYKESTYTNPWNFATDTVTQATTIYAKWKINEYKVFFDSSGGTRIDSVTIQYGNKIDTPTEPTKVGYKFLAWYKEDTCETLWDFETDVVRGQMILYAGWKPNVCTVTFDTNGGSPVPKEIKGDYNAIIASPEEPIKEMYNFRGWYKDVECTIPWKFAADVVRGDMTLYAGWKGIPYKVFFQINGSDTVPEIEGEYGATIIRPEDPIRVGYTLDGWYQDKECTRSWNFASDKVTQATTLYAKWTINRYKVLFQTNGGSPVTEIEDEYNASIERPTDPTREGYTFLDWYKDNEQKTAWNFLNDVITGNITLYGGWKLNNYTVSFELDEGTGVTSVQADHGSTIEKEKPTDPTKAGHTFSGWYKEADYKTSWNFASDKVTQATTIYAKWTINKYTVSFKSLGETVGDPIQIEYNSTIKGETDELARDGYIFTGWYIEEACVTPWDFENDVVTENTTLYAGWTQVHTVTFNTAGGSEVLAIQAEHNTKILKPIDDPTKAGYTFLGWHKEDTCEIPWNFGEDKVTQPTTIYAKWELRSYVVTYMVTNDNSQEYTFATQTVYHGENAVKPKLKPVLTGNLNRPATGWSASKGGTDPIDFATTTITGDTTLYAIIDSSGW